jgi:glycosyltransferase involved in cell wall biosynthesis
MAGSAEDFNRIASPAEETTPPAPTVTVIVPVYNGGENFQRCLTGLKQVVPLPSEIIVVADGDTEGSWQMAVEYRVKTLRLRSRTGPASARNA